MTPANTLTRRTATLVLSLCMAAAFAGEALAQTPPAPVRMRGTILSVTPATLTVKDRSGEVVEVAM